jgi:hypothetical protein
MNQQCMWIEKEEKEKRFHRCEERAIWQLDGVKYCDKHLKSVLFHHPGASYRAMPLGRLALLTNA